VPTPDDAIRAGAWLKNNQAGRATFLVTGLHGGSDEVDVMTFNECRSTTAARRQYVPVGIDGPRIGDILHAPARAAGRARANDAGKNDARIVDTLDDATALSLATGDMFVTTDGDWVSGGQFVNAGMAGLWKKAPALLTFKRELRELESRVGELAINSSSRMSRLKQPGPGSPSGETVVLLNASIAREDREAMARELNYGLCNRTSNALVGTASWSKMTPRVCSRNSRSWRPRGIKT